MALASSAGRASTGHQLGFRRPLVPNINLWRCGTLTTSYDRGLLGGV